MLLKVFSKPVLALSPFQLGAQHIEEGSLGAEQFHLEFGLAAQQVISVLYGHAELAVHAQVSFVAPGFGYNLDLGHIPHHERAMG